MKARTLVIMLCISLMCFTGFGNTTADLTENSTAELVQMDHSVNVVAAPVMDVVFHSFQMESALGFAENKASLPATEFETILTTVLTNYLPDEDVGWQTNRMDYNCKQPTQNSNLRDPIPRIMC